MIKFNKPINLNGTQLMNELNNAGILISKPPFIDGNGNFWLDIDSSKELQALSIVESHNGIDVLESLTVSDKLAAVGLTIEELKEALGL